MAYIEYKRVISGSIATGSKEIKSGAGAEQPTVHTLTKGMNKAAVHGYENDTAGSRWYKISGFENGTETSVEGYIKASQISLKFETYGFKQNKEIVEIYNKEEMDQIIANLEHTSEPKILIDHGGINIEVNNSNPAVMIDIPSDIATMTSILEGAENVEVTINGSETIKFKDYNFFVDGADGYKHWFMTSEDKERRFTLTLNNAENKITLTYRMTSTKTGAKEMINRFRVYANDYNIVISDYTYSKKEIDSKLIDVLKEEKIWENASPTSSFDAQLLKIDITKYKEFKIIPIATPLNHYTFSTLTIPAIVGESGILTANQNYNRERMVTIVSNGIQFGKGNYYKEYANSITTEYNTACIPNKIYGIKED